MFSAEPSVVHRRNQLPEWNASTMSSRKWQLEAAGLLTTEKVHADVGRPRQRLIVAGEGLRDAPPADLMRGARDVLVDGERRARRLPVADDLCPAAVGE